MPLILDNMPLTEKSSPEIESLPLQPIPENRTLTYHLHTLHLLTISDIKTIIIPQTFFALSTALSGPHLTTQSPPSLHSTLTRLPYTLLWIWLNLLIFDIANQRLPASILEDALNKPWRAMPSGRLSHAEARRLLMALIPLTMLASWFLHALPEAAALAVMTWMYNDLGGSGEHYVLRNALNALGLMGYSAGAAKVALGSSYTLNTAGYIWVGVVGAVIFFTIATQDFPDVEGDALIERSTMPLALGETVARWMVGGPMLVCAVGVPWYWGFWGEQKVVFGVTVVATAGLACRILFLRGLKADKMNWKLWCAWTAGLYMLPVIRTWSALAW